MSQNVLIPTNDDAEWKTELANRITSIHGLPKNFMLSEREREYFLKAGTRDRFGLLVPRYFLGLANPFDSNDPVRKQVLPTSEELDEKAWETEDPLCEKEYQAAPLLIRRYSNRALLRITSLCAVHCRHCYRRSLVSEKKYTATESDIRRIGGYLAAHPEIEELLISGGDPLMLEDSLLEKAFEHIRMRRPGIKLRLCTRIPVVLPQRIGSSLVSMLCMYAPLRVAIQINHPAEITPASRKAILSFVDAGLPVLNQTVLLRGVNDDPGILHDLVLGLHEMRVTPYYLFQADLAKGTSHFRVPLERGIGIYSELMRRAGSMPVPAYGLDLPGGGGKVHVCSGNLLWRKNGWFYFKNEDGGIFRYPDD